ncbi:MAG: hypothetical protein CL862_12950 [Cyanobium sp. NAT70]|nr:hypothetical protein [Cyanobium sp. NAT70]|tara:strand:+ start:486 stop:755 length:270 start_codon:yes stop_codon:yes gene_type:complete
MSEEQLKAFKEAVKADASLQKKLSAAGDTDAVVAIAKEAGFTFNTEQLSKAQAEISDDELEVIAGGGCGAWSIASVGTWNCGGNPQGGG